MTGLTLVTAGSLTKLRQVGAALILTTIAPCLTCSLQFAKTGVPVSLRPKAWSFILGVKMARKVRHSTLLAQTCSMID